MAEADNNQMRSKADPINNTDLMSVDQADERERVELIDHTDLVSVNEVDEADQCSCDFNCLRANYVFTNSDCANLTTDSNFSSTSSISLTFGIRFS